MKGYRYSREIARRSGSNFFFSFFFLPRQKREGIFSVYAFSRIVDDAVDEASDGKEAESAIRLWRKRLHLCFNGGSENSGENDEVFHPLLPELSETIRRFHLPEKYFLDLLSGVEMDLTRKRYETFSDLENYCYHVAGTVGLLCNTLFGLNEEKGRRYAVLLGTAFQLTNILRDVGSDAARGRIYIPREDLRRFQVAESDLLLGRTTPAFFELMRFEAGRAEDFFRRALEALPGPERRRILPAGIMASFYREILKKLVKEEFPVFRKKVALSTPKKMALVTKALLNAF